MTSNSKVDLQELFNGTELATTFPDNEKWYSLALDQYKLYVEMADRISQRRATANTYFLSVNSAILAFVGYLTSKDSAQNMWLRACQIFCVNGVSVVNGESIAELNGKTSQRRFPVADRHRPFLADVA